jgi:hypothetical protein
MSQTDDKNTFQHVKKGTIQEKYVNIIPTGLNAPVSSIKPPKRFNELDSKILEDTAAVELDEIAFKLEIKIHTISKEIDLIDDQIRLICITNPKDKNDKLRELLTKKEERENDLLQVKEEYQNLGDFYRMSHKIAEKLDSINKGFKNKINDFSRTKLGAWLFGVLPFFKSRKYLNNTVEKLDTLYKNMEHIVNLKDTPYGEKESNMKDLIEFMKTASILESRLGSFFSSQSYEKK